MSNPGPTPIETILKLCRQAAPEAWYPAEFAAAVGADPRRLEGPIADLRMAGLIEPADVDGRRGPGYRLTRLGQAALKDPQALAALRGPASGDAEDGEPVGRPARPVQGEVLAALSRETRPYVTYGLLAVNVLVFLAGMHLALGGNWQNANVRVFLMIGNRHAQHVTGAVTAADLNDGHWWRLLATLFVHQGFFHLLINASTFLGCGRVVEQLWGRWRYLLVYLLSGLFGVCVALWRDPGFSPVGAAPAVCGITLSAAVWFALNRRHLPRELVRRAVRQMVMAFVWFVAWWAFLSWLGGERFPWDLFVAGGLAGAAVAVPLALQQFTPNAARWCFLLLLPLVPLTGVVLVLRAKEKDPEWSVAVAVQRKERVRQQQDAAQQQKQNREKGDFDKFNQDLLPPTTEASKFITQHWPAVRNLCEQEAGDRDKEEVAGALRTVQEARKQTDDALAAIRAAGALKAERVVDAVATAERYLKEQKSLLELAERCLSGPKWTDEDRKDLDDQARTTRTMWNKLDRMLSPKG